MKVYISGPITDDTDHADKFARAFMLLAKARHEPVSPVLIGRELKYRMRRDPTWEEYMREDIKALVGCDGIFMLDGWEASSGARLEEHIAMRLDIKRIEL